MTVLEEPIKEPLELENFIDGELVPSKGELKDVATNSMCAAGKGSFLDAQAVRMGVDLVESSEFESTMDPPSIATRCAVFAKSDLIHRQQRGDDPAAVDRRVPGDDQRRRDVKVSAFRRAKRNGGQPGGGDFVHREHPRHSGDVARLVARPHSARIADELLPLGAVPGQRPVVAVHRSGQPGVAAVDAHLHRSDPAPSLP